MKETKNNTGRLYEGDLDGAGYKISIPNQWNKKIIMNSPGWMATGTSSQGHNIFPDGPLAKDYLEENGYAWASSSFNPKHFQPHNRHNFVPYEAAHDLAALHDFFIAEFQKPDLSYISGISMGGNVTLITLENFPDRYDGAMAWSSAVGIATLDYEAHTFVLGCYAAGIDSSNYEGVDSVLELAERSLSELRSNKKARDTFLSLYETLTGGARPFSDKTLEDSYEEAVSGIPLIIAMQAFDNIGYIYQADPITGIDTDEINERAIRIKAAPGIRNIDPNFSLPKGDVPVPLIMMHHTGDTSTPFSVMQIFRKSVDQAGNGGFLVQRAIQAPGHNDMYSFEERKAAWDDLFAWVEQGQKADGDNVLGSLKGIGEKFTNPIRDAV